MIYVQRERIRQNKIHRNCMYVIERLSLIKLCKLFSIFANYLVCLVIALFETFETQIDDSET